jgi:hypothetical protein
MTDADAIAIWKQAAAATGVTLSDAQAMAAHQAAKNAQITAGGTLAEGQLNDLLGQVQAGQPPDPTKWRQPITGPVAQPQPQQPTTTSSGEKGQTLFVAPSVAPSATPTAPAQTQAPTVTYTFDWIGNGQQGYRGTDGSLYDVSWNKIGSGGQTQQPTQQNTTGYVAPAAPATPAIPPPSQRSYEAPSYTPGSYESQAPDGSWYFDQSKYDAAHR